MVPLVHLLEYDSIRDIIWNVVGNAAMFIPSGIVLPIDPWLYSEDVPDDLIRADMPMLTAYREYEQQSLF